MAFFGAGYHHKDDKYADVIRNALDFLLKPADEADLLHAVRMALHHHQAIRDKTMTRDLIRARLNDLTPREHEVMRQLITGALNKVVADRLDIAVKTVKVHRANIMQKMGVSSVAELLHLCHLAGVEPDIGFPL
jgi:FixJ family two-component response regulator